MAIQNPILIVFSIISLNLAYSQESINDTKIIRAAFEKQVSIIDSFFTSKPLFLDRQDFHDSPTKEIFRLYKHTSFSLSYDIQRTNSIISPFVAVVHVTFKILNNGFIKSESYSTISSEYSHDWWHTTKKSCFRDTIFQDAGSSPISLTINYAFQDNHWVYKSVSTDPPVAYGYYNDDWSSEENIKWLQAFRGQ
ncbi:MAG: hypothetical protein C0417_07480 [Chlorobiaceae bacterium]|nr:hypothetical protein [Chlorobiaceae bacterium]